MYQAQLRRKPIVVLLSLSLTWGAAWAIVKIGSNEIAPLFMAGIRSLAAGFCLYVWIKIKKVEIFPSRVILLHGVIVGLLFGAEFACIYVGIQYTLISRIYVLLYLAPFFVAVGAHYFLKNDRLNRWESDGAYFCFRGCGAVVSK